jgi:CHAD domain-containing protein
MSLDAKKLAKPIRKVRRALKNTSRQPSPDQVHDIRAQSRRLEAGLAAIRLEQEKVGRRVLESMTPIRKKAGLVRDMDVLTGFASTLSKDPRDQCLIRLLTHLGAERARSARKFHKAVAKNRKQANRSLKAYRALVKEHFKGANQNTPHSQEWQKDAMATALELSTELADWPRLNATNLHAFRLEVKQLSYVLKLADDSDTAYLDALDNTKDAIGEWHDWSDLRAIAGKVISHRGKCPLRKQIDSLVARKFANALSVAARLRKTFLEQEERRNGSVTRPFVNDKNVRGIGYRTVAREGSRAALKALQAASEKKAA